MDPQARAYLDQLAASGTPPFNELSPQDARRAYELATPVMSGPSPPLHRTEDRSIAGVPTRIYSPEARGPLPVLAFFHGGGWVVGSLQTHDAVCRRLAAAAQCLVVGVDYRMAPEHRFPAAVEDAWTVTSWLAAHSAEIGGDGGRLAVAGDSAGGNLAAVVALKARDAGVRLRLQVLVYPVTDADFDTASYRANAIGFLLTRAAMAYYFDHYVPDVAVRRHPDVSPLRAASLTGVAPALLVVCELDPLLDEGEAYARRLIAAGVPVTVKRYEGMIHGFIRMYAVIDRSHDLMAEMASALRGAFGS